MARCLLYQKATFLQQDGARGRNSISDRPSNFTPHFLCIWCQLLFFWWVLFILFLKDSTLRRGTSLETCLITLPAYVVLMVVTNEQKRHKHMKNMCLSLGRTLVISSHSLPSKAGKQEGPTTAGQAGWRARWSTMGLRHNKKHAAMETLSFSPGKQTKTKNSSITWMILSYLHKYNWHLKH